MPPLASLPRVAALLACTAAWPAAAADVAELDPAAVLAQHGLARVDRVWVLADELRLRRDLAELPKRRERLLAVEHDLDQRIEKNRQRWQEAQPAIAALRQSLARLGSEDPQRQLLAQQIDALAAAAAEPTKIGAKSEVRSRVLVWIDERNSLASALASIRGTIGRLGELYEQLAQTPGVAEALRQIGDKNRLGPQRSLAADRERLSEYEKVTYTPWVPIFFQGAQLRLTALIDDLTPVTFTWIDSGGPGIILTRTAAEAAGLKIPAAAPQEAVAISPQKRTTAWRINVARLRLGKCVLQDASVLVLPPEAEDWGCQLSREALSGHALRLEPERLRLSIDAG